MALSSSGAFTGYQLGLKSDRAIEDSDILLINNNGLTTMEVCNIRFRRKETLYPLPFYSPPLAAKSVGAGLPANDSDSTNLDSRASPLLGPDTPPACCEVVHFNLKFFCQCGLINGFMHITHAYHTQQFVTDSNRDTAEFSAHHH